MGVPLTSPRPARTYSRALKSGRHGNRTWAPFDTDTCAIEMGVVVMPGPLMPPISPAMTRISAPASAVVARPTWLARRSWYRGVANFCVRGRFTHNWIPWNRPPDATRSSGGRSMCSNPEPAVIHWVSPLVISPPPPWESACSNVPSMM